MATHSPRYEIVKRYFDRGLWSKQRVAKAVECNWITEAEYEEITGEPYPTAGE